MRLLLLSFVMLSANYSSGQQTYVPDNNFEAVLESIGMGNGIPNDDYVTTANISGVTSLGVWSSNIVDMTGIEDFAALTSLYCYGNQIVTLDVSQNTNLNDLRCYSNLLTTLDVSSNTALNTLFCYNNQLTTIDVSQNTGLNEFRCFNNQFTTLNVTQNSALTGFFCYDNGLTSIDVTQNTNLSDFRCYDNQLATLDVTQNPNLSTLFCYDNQLTTLNTSQNPALDLLFCQGNDITALDLAQNTLMTGLRCYDNDLTDLDISANTAMTLLWCYDNNLSCLNANNGQNLTLDCTNNSLGCVGIANPAWANVNALYDTGVTFQIACSFILDNDVNPAGTMLTAVQGGASYQWLNCDIIDGVITGATNQSYTPATSGYYAVEITYVHPCSGTQIDTSSCHHVDFSSIDELSGNTAELVKITDLMGREVPFQVNTALIYIYSNGTAKRVFKLEE